MRWEDPAATMMAAVGMPAFNRDQLQDKAQNDYAGFFASARRIATRDFLCKSAIMR
jgi:hypothetical protein